MYKFCWSIIIRQLIIFKLYLHVHDYCGWWGLRLYMKGRMMNIPRSEPCLCLSTFIWLLLWMWLFELRIPLSSSALSSLQYRLPSLTANSSPGMSCRLHAVHWKQSMWYILSSALITKSARWKASPHLEHGLVNNLQRERILVNRYYKQNLALLTKFIRESQKNDMRTS